jgi:hypothetical protein
MSSTAATYRFSCPTLCAATHNVGQLQFYVEWAEQNLRRPGHLPTIGILLVDDKEDVVVR